jgi:CRISPR-associated helicase Cas3
VTRSNSAAGTVYLVYRRAVSANLSGDDLVCDLATYEIMVRRLGRANRFGDRNGTRIEIVHPQKFDGGDRMETRRARALALLKSLDGDGSPKALAKLAKSKSEAVLRAFGPLPKIPKTSDILLDSPALTPSREILPGRPPVTPLLRGVSEGEVSDNPSRVAEVTLITGDDRRARPACLIEDYPLKSIERFAIGRAGI